MPDPHDDPQQAGRALDRLGRDARVEQGMLKPDQPITDTQRRAVIREAQSYRDGHKVAGRPLSLAKAAAAIGVSESVLSEWLKDKYAGDVDRVTRMVDAFLAREAQSASGPNIRTFRRIKLVENLHAACKQAIQRRSIGVVTGEPGIGKTGFLDWLVCQSDGAVKITADPKDCDAKFVVDALYVALKLSSYTPSTRERKRQIVEYLQSHQNTILLVDECQFLTNDALEILRALHDQSDPEGVRNVPVLLFGDSNFYKVVMSSRAGRRTPLSPQITSRMFPVLEIDVSCIDHDDSGQVVPNSLFTREDIEQIVSQNRLRLFRPEALDYAVKLAHVHGYGRLRLASRVMEIAIQIKRAAQVTLDDMRAAMGLFLGPADADVVRQEIDRQQPAARRAAAAG